MLLTKLNLPIHLINFSESGIDIARFLSKTSEYYSEFQWDHYLHRQDQIELIKEMLPAGMQACCTNELCRDYYLGVASEADLNPLLRLLTKEQKGRLDEIKPTRRRAISEFEIRLDPSFSIDRISAKSFGQGYAKVSSEEAYDYRMVGRKFEELAEYKADEDLIKMLHYLANKLHARIGSLKSLNVVVHHTQVVCYPGRAASNSPEGVHQDGMDYIVSALVVDRKNVRGGRSIIFGKDKRTSIFEALLLPGQGILQPDKNSELWHSVTPIECIDNETIGTRSTIGFDFTARVK